MAIEILKLLSLSFRVCVDSVNANSVTVCVTAVYFFGVAYDKSTSKASEYMKIISTSM